MLAWAVSWGQGDAMDDLREVAGREPHDPLTPEDQLYAGWCEQVRSGVTTMSWPMFRSLNESPPTFLTLKWHDGY